MSNNTPHHRSNLWAGDLPTTAELLDVALIDALGLLDDDERRAFDAAFDRAPAALQRQIREDQGRLLAADGLFPKGTPADALRDKSIRAVQAAMEADRKKADAEPARARRAAHAAGRAAPKIRQPRRVHGAWRASALALAVAVVALAAVQLRLQRDYSNLSAEAGLAQLIDTIGTARLQDTLISTSSRRIAFSPAKATNSTAAATLWVNEDTGAAWIYTYRLPGEDGATYKVVTLDENDNVVGDEITSFANSGVLAGVTLSTDITPGSRLGIVLVAANGGPDQLLFTADIPLA